MRRGINLFYYMYQNLKYESKLSWFYLFRVEQLTVSSNADLVDNGWFEVHEDRPGHVLARPGLGEEGGVGVVPAAGLLFRGHGAVWLDAVLEAVELPARIADLAARLAHVDRDTLTLETNQG